MKKRVLTIALAACMLMALASLGTAGLAADGEYTAYFGAQMDPVDGWDLGEVSQAAFKIGEAATISIDFGEVVSFGDGNYIAIETNVPNPYAGITIFQDPGIAEILSFKLDGSEVEMGDVLINAEGKDAIDGSGAGLRLTLTNKWNGDIAEQPVDPLELGEFTTLEIEFIVHAIGEAPVTDGDGAESSIIKTGNAWIGGTFAFSAGHPAAKATDDPFTFIDWYDFPEQSAAFEIGVPFTVSLDMGSETLTHDEASFGYIFAIDTDNETNPLDLQVYIESIKVDGNDIDFDAFLNDVGKERGCLRVALTNVWTKNDGGDTILPGPSAIGTFSQFEITMLFVEYGEPNPFMEEGAEPPTEEEFTPPPSVEPLTRPADLEDNNTSSSSSSGSDSSGDSGLPGWVVPVIIGVALVIVVVVVIVVVKGKKKD